MDCPTKEVLQDYLDGELSTDKARSIREHVQSCDSCKNKLRKLFSFYSTLNQFVNQEKCPSFDLLESFSSCPDKDSSVKTHVELCARCKSYVWAFQATDEELAEWQKQDVLAYQEYEAHELGYDTAKETLQKLLPNKLEMLDNVWQSVLTLVLDLKEKAMESWPSLDKGSQLAGVLGFEESYDPETEAASIIMATTLYISQAISDGQVKPYQEDIEASIKEVATRLGAGKELLKRLIETVPPIILKFK